MRDQIQRIIIEALDAQSRLFDRPFSNPLGPETPLLGDKSEIDSMALVVLIVDVEQGIQAEFGRPITLVNERAMASHGSPFRNVASMAQYAAGLLAGAAA